MCFFVFQYYLFLTLSHIIIIIIIERTNCNNIMLAGDYWGVSGGRMKIKMKIDDNNISIIKDGLNVESKH